MSALILRNHSHNNITIVENDFIDHYMVSANGEYVKVYLLLLRYQNIPEQLPDIPQMADLLENTEGDILRALKYWEKEGILSLEYDETNELAGICIGKAPTHQTPVKAAFHGKMHPQGVPRVILRSPLPYTFRTVCFRS